MVDHYIINDVNNQWFHYRSIMGIPSRRLIFCGIGWIVSILSLIFFAFVFMAVKSNAVRSGIGAGNFSEDEYSLKLYKSFPSALNVSVDPCVDFYTFSCGLWGQNNPIPSYDARVTTFSVLQDIVKAKKKATFEAARVSEDLPHAVNNALKFYNACVERNAAKDSKRLLLNQYLNPIGGWPILKPSEWNETLFDWLHASAFLIKRMDLHTVVGVYVTDDDKSGGRNVVYLKQPSVLDDKEHTLEDVSSVRMLYVILKVLNDYKLNPGFREDIENLQKVELKWRQLLFLPKKSPEPVHLTIDGLSQKIPGIDWLNYLQLITNDTLLKLNETLVLNDTVVVENIDYLYKIANISSSGTFSKRELADLFGWFVVKGIWILIPGVSKKYAELSNYDTDDIKIATVNQCFDLVSETFSSSLDYLFVKNSSHAGSKDGRLLTKYLKSAFKDIVEKSRWLDNETKLSVLKKLNDMQYIIGFVDYLNNRTLFDNMFEKFPMFTDNILKYYLSVQEFYNKKRILSLRIPGNDTNWVLPRSVSDVSAYYIVYKNTLVYPISLQNPPFYYHNGPWYLNFGAIGSMIGHEMMHGFDNYGSQGNVLNATWLSNSSRKTYLELAECFRLQYSDFDKTGRYRNNGTRTFRENIADSEGLRVAFNAYKKYSKDFGDEGYFRTPDDYSPDQMFFIAYASVWCSEISLSLRKAAQSGTHSFPELRVNNAVSNSESFAAAFNCPKGCPMNPSKKCSIW